MEDDVIKLGWCRRAKSLVETRNVHSVVTFLVNADFSYVEKSIKFYFQRGVIKC